MFIRCFGSGSSGNCYALVHEDEILLLDAGVKYKDVLKGIDYRISDVAGLLVTHEHGDHAKYVSDFTDAGITVFEPYKGGKQSIKLGGFKVDAFPLPHDNVENRGFLITHKEMGKLLYLTDLEYCKYTFKKQKINHIICECNYDMEYVDKSIPNYEHILRGHLSLGQCKEIVRVNQTEDLQNVILAHLSHRNSNCKQFRDEVQKVANCPVYVACKGLEIEI